MLLGRRSASVVPLPNARWNAMHSVEILSIESRVCRVIGVWRFRLYVGICGTMITCCIFCRGVCAPLTRFMMSVWARLLVKEENICVSSAQSLEPLCLQKVPWPDVCDRHRQVVRLHLKESLIQCWLRGLTNSMIPDVVCKHLAAACTQALCQC